MRWTVLIPLVALTLTACTSISSLSSDTAGPPLSEDERVVVREQVDKARADERWPAAWNQEVEAGADRARLEAIAIEAVDDESPDAPRMFQELVEKWGGLTPEGRQRTTALVDAAVADRDWTRAVSIEVATAEDAPKYERAFEIYRRAPPHKAPALLQQIRRARKDAS